MDSQKQQAAERIKEANNILVTVSNNPSVDQLAACIGVTLALNKMGKHATAVFSGAVPSTIEFLQPEKTLEKNTDSLRDFIIALDKSKADKLRYKVEDRVVKIFITPYKTSISEKDLEFSQGDFNVDVVLALGVHSQAELDQAITSHGRILHDATVVTLNVKPGGELGTINWLDPNASSLSELGVQLLDMLDKKLVDGQIATAMLTGIVAETERFSNSKTSPQTMSISAELMAEGANQQLVATKLEEPAAPPPAPARPIAQEGEKKEDEEAPAKPDDGTLEISHDEKAAAAEAQAGKATEEPAPAAEEKPAEEEHHEEQPQPEEKPEEVPPVAPATDEHKEETDAQQLTPPPALAEESHETVAPQIHIDEHGSLTPLEELLPPPKSNEPPSISHHNQAPRMVIQPPTLGGSLTASATSGFGEQEETGLGMPTVEAPELPSAPNPTIPNGPVGRTIMPPSDDEAPSGGAQPVDSFLVGNGSTPSAHHPAIPAPTVPEPAQPPVLPATDADAGAGRTLSELEKDVHSPHVDATTAAGPMDSPGPATNDNILPPPTGDGPQIPIVAPTDGGDTTLPSMPPLQDSLPTTGPADAGVVAAGQPADDTSAIVAPDVSSARDAVAQAISGSSTPSLDPIESLNAQPVNLPVGAAADTNAATAQPAIPATPVQPWVPPTEPAQPAPANTEFNPAAMNIETDSDPDAPPPVPPPMMPPTNPY